MNKKKAFRKAVKGFNPPVIGEWGKWQELDMWRHREYGILPPTGMTKILANDRYIVEFFDHQTSWLPTDFKIPFGLHFKGWNQGLKHE